MNFKFRGQAFTIHGTSFIEFDELGFVKKHRDYWDLAEEVYEKIPGIGIIFKGLKKIFG